MGRLLYLVTLLILFHILSFCTCQDNIVPGQYISGNQILVSSLRTFQLGFFNPENSTKYFLGIRFNTFEFPNTPPVWVANRESPLDSPGFFMLNKDGNLVVLDLTRNLIVWSSNVSLSASAMNHTTGLLDDTGNLVLSFNEVTLWRSFDHPSDTTLPGIKISLNKTSGQQRRLTSWAALDDPQPGKFTFGIDPKVTGQEFTWYETTPYYRTHVSVGKGSGAEFQNQGGIAIFFSYNFDVDEVYAVFSVSDSSIKLRVWLNPTGKLQVLLWQGSSKTWLKLGSKPNDKCDFYAYCGPYGACNEGAPPSSPCKCLPGFTAMFPNQWAVGNWSGGCVREKVLKCGIGIQGNFLKLEIVKLPDRSVLLNNRRSMSECESECRHNCSCTAYAYVNAKDGSNIGTCLA